ncbi:hypothetical protein N7507_005315 [Penicillium longicatenatum]|nr:hypothetical protein N7507_005315 [Penicillium longicatenatum]
MGFIHTFTVPYSPEMNGPGERSGGVLTLQARALIKEGKLLDKLWPEAIAAAIYLLNRTPTRLENGSWIVPWEETRGFVDRAEIPRTSLANIRADSAADQGVGIEEENKGYSGDLTPETPISMLEGSSPAQTDLDKATDKVEDVDRAALDIGNIVNGPRARRQRRDKDFAYKTTTSVDSNTTSVTL